MSQQISPYNVFHSNSQAYFFAASIFTNTEKYVSSHGLDMSDCISFEYRNQINSFSINAILTFIDRYSIIDKYLEKPMTKCTITFSAVKTKMEDGQQIPDKLDENSYLNLIFFVSKIEIVSREGKNIVYKLHMVSENWLNLMSTVNYTNYGKPPEQIFKIIKNIIKQVELDIDDKTFDTVKSEVYLNYITNGNDNAITAIKYLLSKMMYYKKFDESWKFIYYDEQKNKYKLFDFNNIQTCNGHNSIILSMFNSQCEAFYQEKPIQLYTTNSFNNAQTFCSSYGFRRTVYDYQHNIFINDKIKNEDMVNLRNKSFVDFSKPYYQKYEKIFDSKLNFYYRTNYWNDNLLMSRYNNLSRTLCENNSLIVECAGEINLKPSDAFQISLDRKVQNFTSENPDIQDDVKHRYAGFEGAWITSRIQHTINFKETNSPFRTKIFLFRNYITDTIEKTAKE